MRTHYAAPFGALALLLVLAACSSPAEAPTPAPAAASSPAAAAAPAATAAPAAAAPTAAPLAAPVKVRIASQFASTDLGHFIAVERGYYQREGLDVELINFSDASQMIPALAT